MRDYPFLGPIAVASSVPIPRQAHSTADTGLALFQGYNICSNGQLPTVQQGGLDEPWQQRHKQDKGIGV